MHLCTEGRDHHLSPRTLQGLEALRGVEIPHLEASFLAHVNSRPATNRSFKAPCPTNASTRRSIDIHTNHAIAYRICKYNYYDITHTIFSFSSTHHKRSKSTDLHRRRPKSTRALALQSMEAERTWLSLPKATQTTPSTCPAKVFTHSPVSTYLGHEARRSAVQGARAWPCRRRRRSGSASRRGRRRRCTRHPRGHGRSPPSLLTLEIDLYILYSHTRCRDRSIYDVSISSLYLISS